MGRHAQRLRRIRRVARETGLLAVARHAGAQVALGLEAVARRRRHRQHDAGRVARPARRVKALEARAGAEWILRLAAGQSALGIGRDAETLVAAEAEGLVAMT